MKLECIQFESKTRDCRGLWLFTRFSALNDYGDKRLGFLFSQHPFSGVVSRECPIF